MARFLYRVGDLCRRHRWSVITAWLLLLIATSTAAATLQQPLGNQFRIPGAQFQKVMDTLKASLPEAAGETAAVVVTAPAPFTQPQQQAVAAAVAQWTTVPGVAGATDPFPAQARIDGSAAELRAGRAQLTAARQQLTAGTARLDAAQRAGAPQASLAAGRAELAKAAATLTTQERTLRVQERSAALVAGTRLVATDGRVALVQLRFTGQANALDTSARDRIRGIGDALERSGVTVDYDTAIVGDLDSVVGATEVVGVVVAATVLVVLLGTLLAAGLPLLLALVGVAVGIGGTLALSSVVQMNSITPALGLMLGLAVGIDYALFIINRHRTQLLLGIPAEESLPRANGTAGNAVVFAGLTVVIALAALVVVGIPFLAVMGLAAAGTVVVAVLAAVTLTPALLAVLGHRVLPARLWARHGFTPDGHPVPGREHLVDHDEVDPQPVRLRHGWVELVTARPWAATVACLALLGLLAVPAASLRLGLPDGGSEPQGSTAHRAYTLTARSFGDGANGPLVAVLTLPAGLDPVAAQETAVAAAERIAAVPGVVRALPIGQSGDQRIAAVQVVPERGPADPATVELVEALRAAAGPIRAATGAELGLTGQTVANIDISAKLAAALLPYLAIVVGLSLLILVTVFRSLIVPLVATGGFLLSTAAAFGAVVAVYQWGWLADVFGVGTPSAVLSFLPTLLIGVLFGLAMDYQMFLVSGMREAHVHGQDARRAVLTGFHHGRRVVAAAALIMVAVFGGFVFAELTMIRPIGFGLAVGVLVDAFVVRMTLTPAVMHLLAERAWWLPRRLDRLVPDVDVEGARLAGHTPAGAPQPELTASR